jgi:LPXTG-site transpeptidase (sortase) family protein
MPASLVVFALFALLSIPSNNSELLAREITVENGPAQPMLPPDTSAPTPEPAINIEAAARDVEGTLHPEARYPTQIVIPSLQINSWVEHVGVNAAGEMEVPDGAGTNVGWYKFGTVPGENGSAVMDAHVYAAFKKLKSVKIGSSIYVLNAKGETLHFKVISSKVYPVSGVPMDAIFTDTSGTYLNLITCEGRFIRSMDSYDKRRVVYAELVD